MRRSTAVVECPKSMVGRVIGKNGETIKALQSYSGALIQIDQTMEPTKVTISGTPHSLSLAVSMVSDIVKGTFKGFALLRQVTQTANGTRASPLMPPTPFTPVAPGQPRPVYAPGYGLIPPSQLYGNEDRTSAALAAYTAAQLPGGAPQQQQFNWAGGQVSPSQMILGLQPAGAVGANNVGLLNGQLQQMSMQPAYGMGGPYGGLAYYQPDYSGGLQDGPMMYGDPVLYQQMMAAAASQQQPPSVSVLGGDATARMTAGRMNGMHAGGGPGRGSGAMAAMGSSKAAAHDWLPSAGAAKLGGTGNSTAVSDLLGSVGSAASGPGAMSSVMGAGPGQGNLVMDQDGKVFFYNPLQDS